MEDYQYDKTKWHLLWNEQGNIKQQCNQDKENAEQNL